MSELPTLSTHLCMTASVKHGGAGATVTMPNQRRLNQRAALLVPKGLASPLVLLGIVALNSAQLQYTRRQSAVTSNDRMKATSWNDKKYRSSNPLAGGRVTVSEAFAT
jgi:hypothetical protein